MTNEKRNICCTALRMCSKNFMVKQFRKNGSQDMLRSLYKKMNIARKFVKTKRNFCPSAVLLEPPLMLYGKTAACDHIILLTKHKLRCRHK